MEDRHFNAMVDNIAERVPSAKDQIRAEFKRVRQTGEIATLSSDEVNLLEDYRMWKRSSNAAGGVFHWKKRR